MIIVLKCDLLSFQTHTLVNTISKEKEEEEKEEDEPTQLSFRPHVTAQNE